MITEDIYAVGKKGRGYHLALLGKEPLPFEEEGNYGIATHFKYRMLFDTTH
jgi:hypothetical protein